VTIRNLILEKINHLKFIIPAIQRKYVWDEKDICKFFDSIMRDYPIGQILLWNVTSEYINSKQVTFYKFLDEYDEKSNEYNKPVGAVKEGDDYYAVLDGQQRIQSLIIGLNGFYTTKTGKKKELYLNLKPNINQSENEFYDDEDNMVYEFKFFAEDNLKKNEAWFKVKDILNVNNAADSRKIIDSFLFLMNEEEKNKASDILSELKLRINDSEKIIQTYTIDKKFEINEVLEIFIRTNSGGEKLSRSDLLFSTVILKWDNGRDTIDDFLKTINNNGSELSFKFDIDFIMRTFLFIKGTDTTMKIEYFDEIAEGIEKNWEKIRKAIEKVVRNLRSIKFSDSVIRSYNSIIPLVYYAYNGGKFDSTNLNEITKYLTVAQLQRIFGAASNQALLECKKVLTDKKDFKLEYFYNSSFAGGRTFKINEDDIINWMNYNKDTMEATLILRLLYSNINYGSAVFHKDHVHPRKLIDDCNNPEFNKYKDKIPNLQMLLELENEKKLYTPLKEWMQDSKNKDKYITTKMSLEIEDFLDFVEKRKKKMVDELKNIFDVK